MFRERAGAAVLGTRLPALPQSLPGARHIWPQLFGLWRQLYGVRRGNAETTNPLEPTSACRARNVTHAEDG